MRIRRKLRGYRHFENTEIPPKPRRKAERGIRNPNAISEHPKAGAVLAMIQSQKLSTCQIAKRVNLQQSEVENVLIWIENHVCLLAEDENGKVQIYEEG